MFSVEATARLRDPSRFRVNRVEIKAIDPPVTIKEAMEEQMRAERDKRAAILHAEGERQAKILTADGTRLQQILEGAGRPGERHPPRGRRG